MVDEERSAEYREALRELRDAREAKSPERAIYDMIFKLRDAREYVRAVGKVSDDEMSFLHTDRRPEIVAAMRDLALTIVDVLASSRLNNEPVAADALSALKQHIAQMQGGRVNDVIIPGEIYEPTAELIPPDTIGGTLT